MKGRGCDCRGLIYGIARELSMPEAYNLEGAVCNYRKDFDASAMLRGLEACLVRTSDAMPGDILAIEIPPREGPRHLAILTGGGRMVHCYGGGPIKRVIEVPVGRSRPIHSMWTWPSLGE